MALTDKLSAIGVAIRQKTGSTELMTLDEMPTAIASITTGGGGGGDCNGIHLPEEALVINGDCQYRFAGDGWNWFIEAYGDKITTNIAVPSYMFYLNDELTNIPFEFNFSTGGGNGSASSMFAGCSKLKEIPPIALYKYPYTGNFSNMFQECQQLTQIGKLSNFYPGNLQQLFQKCYRLRELPEVENWDMSEMHSGNYSNMSAMLEGCYSLRSVSDSWMQILWGAQTSAYYSFFYRGFKDCASLDGIYGLIGHAGTATSNLFTDTFLNCSRVKDVIFATQEDGTPYARNWKSQVINLASNIGYADSTTEKFILNYNSGITADKKISDQNTYDALKNDPDSYVTYYFYSRYNHDSAVRTINSLPDTSAYLASAGGTNTIKFSGGAGKMTDEGGINTLTEEEIAVATAKGWTVSII